VARPDRRFTRSGDTWGVHGWRARSAELARGFVGAPLIGSGPNLDAGTVSEFALADNQITVEGGRVFAQPLPALQTWFVGGRLDVSFCAAHSRRGIAPLGSRVAKMSTIPSFPRHA